MAHARPTSGAGAQRQDSLLPLRRLDRPAQWRGRGRAKLGCRDRARSHVTHADPVHNEVLGQPRGLVTLFLTEMWERFSYYGMRAILILYAVAAVSDGGFGLDDHVASAIYGLYIAATYVFALLGGWMADRLLGAQRAVIVGGILIMGGNALLVLGHVQSFFLGLVVIVLGVGLLTPNISVMVAELYPEGGARRDAGFSIFYVGTSVGALLGSLLVPLAAARFGWRWGFALPVVGMMLGLGQFMLTRKWLGHRGRVIEERRPWRAWLPGMGFVAGGGGGGAPRPPRCAAAPPRQAGGPGPLGGRAVLVGR